MDQEALVNALRRSRRELEKSLGRIRLLLLIAPDFESTDSWNVLVSADGLEDKSRGTAIRAFSAALRRTLDRSFWPGITRITVLKADNPFVRAFSSVQAGTTLYSVHVSGVDLGKVIVIESKRKAA